MTKIKVTTGNVFIVPLRSEGYGIGIVARKYRSRLLGYFWKRKFQEVPINLDLSALAKEDTFWIIQFGIKGLSSGSWKILGDLPNFNPDEWSVPQFIREVEPFGKYLITYDDKLQFINQEKISDNYIGAYPEDGVAGYGYVELKLTDFLG